MRYAAKTDPEDPDIAALREALITILRGLGLLLIELSVSRHKGAAQVRVVVYKSGDLGIDECSRAHRAILPRLELALEARDLYVEVSSPGIDRLIKDGREASHYRGRGVRCYRTDISGWSCGILEEADEEGLVLKNKEGTMRLHYEIIAKAKLCSAENMDSVQEV